MFNFHIPLLGLFLITSACLGQQTNNLFAAGQLDALKKGQLGAFDEIVFATRSLADDGHWYANISYYSSPYQKPNFGKNGRLCAWNIKTGGLRCLLEDIEGAVRDPCISTDAKKNPLLLSQKGRGELPPL